MMEAVLALYAKRPDPRRPLVCFDEAGKALQGHVRPPQAAQGSRPGRYDTEYTRAGSAALHVWVAPHTGQYGVHVTAQRTRHEFALAMRDLVEVQFPDAEEVQVVLDNLNTHHIGAIYDAFPPAEAARIADRLRFTFTPVHGSWLNMAELAISMLSRSCLGQRRFATQEALAEAVTAWAAARNAQPRPIVWQLRRGDARRALWWVYPNHDKQSRTEHSG